MALSPNWVTLSPISERKPKNPLEFSPSSEVSSASSEISLTVSNVFEIDSSNVASIKVDTFTLTGMIKEIAIAKTDNLMANIFSISFLQNV